jgi:hypothetical protein
MKTKIDTRVIATSIVGIVQEETHKGRTQKAIDIVKEIIEDTIVRAGGKK